MLIKFEESTYLRMRKHFNFGTVFRDRPVQCINSVTAA